MADTAFSCLETARLRLRRFCAGDLDAFVAYRSQPETARFQSWDAPFPEAEARAFLAELVTAHPDTPGQWFQFAVVRRDDDRLIGDIGLKRMLDDLPDTMEVGYTLDARETGQGFAGEAVAAVLDYAFLRGMARVEAWADTRHERSLALLARMGFAPIDAPPRIGVFKGETCSDIGHVMTAQAWHARR
jgi:RimJ/RimL family protein N-acetyltransferase